jgi:hypothetical protein
MRFMDQRARSKILIDKIAMPVGSDRFMKERLFHLPNRGQIRRTVNAQPVWIANGAGGRLFGFELSSNDIDIPALDGVWEGSIYAITPTQMLHATIWPGTTTVNTDRVPIAGGLDPEGIIIHDQFDGSKVVATQSGAAGQTFTLAAARATPTIIKYRFTAQFMLKPFSIDRDVSNAKSTSKLEFEEVTGTSA